MTGHASPVHKVYPLDAHEAEWRCWTCGHTFMSASGRATCPNTQPRPVQAEDVTGIEDARRQVEEAHRVLTAWDAGRLGPSSGSGRERVLAGQVRTLLAIIGDGYPDSLASANSRRQADAADRDAHLARLIMDTGWVWERLDTAERRVVEARSAGRGESWAQVGGRLHMSKDTAAGLWRRLLFRWDVQKACAGGNDPDISQ